MPIETSLKRAARVFSRYAALSVVLSGSAGCGSSESSPNPTGPSLDPLFTDPKVPRCDKSKSYRVAGQLEGQTIDVAIFEVCNLEPQRLQIPVVVAGSIREDLELVWTVPLAENTALPVTGGQIRIPDNQPLGGQSFCISSGKFGSPTPVGDGGEGRQLLFQITGGSDCNGADVSISLNACILRWDGYFPVPTMRDAGGE